MYNYVYIMVKIIIWKMYLYATLNNNKCQIIMLIFALYFIFKLF